jgi:hypothetical protein
MYIALSIVAAIVVLIMAGVLYQMIGSGGTAGFIRARDGG